MAEAVSRPAPGPARFPRAGGWFLVGLGLICLTDYISTIYEVRIARETYHTPWTVRIGGVPLAEIFVLGAFALACVAWLRDLAARGGRLRSYPLDWYFWATVVGAAYGVAVGALTFTARDSVRELLYDMRLVVDFVLVYLLVSRMPRSAGQSRTLWRWVLGYGGVFFTVNLGMWVVWVFGFHYVPLGVLNLGTLLLTDAGNVVFFSYLSVLGAILVITGTESGRMRFYAGVLGLASAAILVLSYRRANMLAVGVGVLLAASMLMTWRSVVRTVRLLPLVLAGVLVLAGAGLNFGRYGDAFLTLLDRSYASTELRYVGDENVFFNLDRQQLWLTGLGLGRRYEYAHTLAAGENISAFSEEELGRRWRNTLHVSNPLYALWLRDGLVVGTALGLLPLVGLLWTALLVRRRYAHDRDAQVLIVVTLVAAFGVPFPALAPIDPKNAMLSGAILGLCSATMRLTRAA
jgi:hypothetical protein